VVYNWLRQEYSTPEIAHTSGTQFTGLSGTKVQILSQMLLADTKVQILTQEYLYLRDLSDPGTQFTGFTGTKVQILTQEVLQRGCGRHTRRQT
jgi:hypothetical protein